MYGLETALKHLFVEQNSNKQWLSRRLVADGIVCGKQTFDGADVIKKDLRTSSHLKFVLASHKNNTID